MSATAAIPGRKKQSAIQEGLRWGGIVLGQRSTKAQRVEAVGRRNTRRPPAPPERC